MSGLLAHYPAIHGGQKGIWRHHFKPDLLGCFWHTAIVASRAIFLEKSFPRMFININ
jgi:hypothetical protein